MTQSPVTQSPMTQSHATQPDPSSARGSPSAAPLVFITGASSGMGQALARQFHQAGYRLALVARRSEELRAWAVGEGWDAGSWAVYAADVTQPASIARAGRDSLAAQGLADIVIANAGISVGYDTADFEDLGVLRATFETNLLGMAATFQPFVAPMRERGTGTLVGIASVAGIRGLPGHGAYSASKAAVISYCESLRVELRDRGVKVVTLVPGYVDTPLTQGNPYSMPFLMSAEAFARIARGAIERGRSYQVIPWQMAIVSKLLRVLPNAVFDRVVARRGRKPRRPR